MPNIITRYLALEILKSCCATVLILFIILMSNALGRVLSDIADGDVPQQALWPVLLSQSVNIFSMLLPIGFFLGIVFAFGRLYKDHEMVVMQSCGMGYRHFYRSILLVIVPVFLLSVYTSVWLNSQVQRSAKNSVDREKNSHEFEQIRAGQFNQSKNGDHVFFMKSVSDDRLELSDIIISQTNRGLMILETAKTGRHKTDEVTGDLFLVVGPGQRTEGRAGEKEYRIIDFEQHGILIEKKKNHQKQVLREKEKSPGDLWRSGRLNDKVELQWRFAIPVVLLLLALLAVPLSYIAPRQGRYGKVGYALLVYIVYFNLLAYTRAQLEAESFPLVINFWWVHLGFLLLTLGLLLKRNRGSLFSNRLVLR
ncbi:MAG: LPS export ABC transporter permease LptF [Proteobacteria bacterium]|nr:LPS export ABC transporter permease LptF [Pseudomonadota bacterium]